MADAKPIYLYPTRAENDTLKEAAEAAGATIKFDRDKGAYQLMTDGVSKDDVTAQKKALKAFTGKAAEGRWSEDREAKAQEMAAVRSAAKGREKTTKEPKPEKAPAENRILVYPALSQKDEFVALVKETGSTHQYHRGSANQEAHYSVVTDVPDRFAGYQGQDAETRFKTEFAARSAEGVGNEAVNGMVEQARDAARARGSASFMAQYKERGFRLADPSHDAANHAKQLDSMRVATNKQLIAVAQTSRDLLEPLRNKEIEMRAEAAGLPVEQVRAMSFADQKKLAVVDGKPVGLVGDEFKLNQQLSRGIAAINAELRGRGVGLQKVQENERSNENDRPQEQQRSNQRSNERGAERPQAGKTVDQDKAVEDDYALMRASMAQRGRNAGR